MYNAQVVEAIAITYLAKGHKLIGHSEVRTHSSKLLHCSTGLFVPNRTSLQDFDLNYLLQKCTRIQCPRTLNGIDFCNVNLKINTNVRAFVGYVPRYLLGSHKALVSASDMTSTKPQGNFTKY